MGTMKENFHSHLFSKNGLGKKKCHQPTRGQKDEGTEKEKTSHTPYMSVERGDILAVKGRRREAECLEETRERGKLKNCGVERL